MDWIEIVGIVASLIVLASFLMKDILVIRLVNIVGAVVFIVYGILIGAFATWFVNAALMIVHIIYIIKELKEKKLKAVAVEQSSVNEEEK